MKEINCFSIESFKIPPFFNAEEDWLKEFTGKNDTFPKFEELQRLSKQKNEIEGIERFKVASGYLSSDYISDDMIKQITGNNNVYKK